MRAKIVRKCNLRHALNLRFNLSLLALFAGHGGNPHTPSTTLSHAEPINTPGVGFICAGGVWYSELMGILSAKSCFLLLCTR